MSQAAPLRRPRYDHPVVGRLLLWGGLAAIGLLTLLPTDPSVRGGHGASPVDRVLDPGYLSDILLNLLLFAPFGAGLQSRGFGWRRTLVVGAGVSGVIESLQLSLIANRDAGLHDLVANTAGCLIGWWFWISRHDLAHPRTSAWRRRFFAMAMIPIMAWIAGAYLVRVDSPRGDLHWIAGSESPDSEWAVTSVDINRREGSGKTGAVPDALGPGRTIRANLVVRHATQSVGLTRLLTIETTDHRPVAELWRVGDGVELRPRLRLTRLGFGAPRLRMPEVVTTRSDSIRIGVIVESRWIRLSAEPDRQPARGFPIVLTPQFLLAAAIGSAIPVDHRWRWLVAVWLFLQLAPMAVVAGDGDRPRTRGLALIGVAGLGAAAMLGNGLAGLPIEAPLGWLGIGGAVALGWVWRLRSAHKRAGQPMAGRQSASNRDCPALKSATRQLE